MLRLPTGLLCAMLIVALLVPGGVVLTAPEDQADTPGSTTATSPSTDTSFDAYAARHGGSTILGEAISRPFRLRGADVQLYERMALQRPVGKGIEALNLLELVPYTPIEGYALPASDPGWVAAIPSKNSPTFGADANAYVATYVPDTSRGLPVKFYSFFTAAGATSGVAGTRQNTETALEIWGFPTSPVTADPGRPNLVYQRFERGYFYFNSETGATGAIRLGSYFRQMLSGAGQPADLANQAQRSSYWAQYSPLELNWIARPSDLPDSDLSQAFSVDMPPLATAAAATPIAQSPTAPIASSGFTTVAPSSSAAAPNASAPLAPDAAPLFRARSPEYGMNVFIWDSPATTDRDLQKLQEARFAWQKSLFQWRLIEPSKGVFDWTEADRVVQASNAAGIKIIARVDFQPTWARADGAHNGPPDNYEDFGNFLYALADHFKPDSPNGTIAAIELWNEPNLAREWGEQAMSPSSAADYVRLMCIGHQAVKRAAPAIVTISAGLSPTGTINERAVDDTIFLQWMYDAGARECFDVLGAHGAGYKAPPHISPSELATNRTWGGHASFGFRRVEQLRDTMVRNGDQGKQVWLLEFGWSSDSIHEAYSWHRVTEEQKAEYIVEAFRWAYVNWQSWIGVMTLWTMAAPDWTPNREEYWWAITLPDGQNLPAFDALVTARRSGYLP